MTALIFFFILAWALPGSFLMWCGIFLAAFVILLLALAKSSDDEESGRKPTMREINGGKQDIKVYIETNIEKMYAAGKSDVDVAHAFDFFQFPMWLFYHPFLVWDSNWWRPYDTQRLHQVADDFRARMHAKYPQAYSHYASDPTNTYEIREEFMQFQYRYCKNRGTTSGGYTPPARREPTAREKSIAWTLVTGDPVLGHALGHKDDKEDDR